jgi:CO/xanthine dehydrogenase FAD-binding subunit
MRGADYSMKVLRPKSVREAIKIYGEVPGAVPLAGGTDFMVSWNAGLSNGKTVLDLSGLTDWTKIVRSKGNLNIGALVTHSQIHENELIQKEFPLLVDACRTIGGAAIQNRGTLGGNIANASPAADTFPALAVYEPTVHVVGLSGTREVPFLDIFAGVKKTRLAPSELISSVELRPLARRPSRRIFRKVGTRAAQAISKTAMAGLLWLNKDGSVAELRAAFNSVATTVRRLKTVEAFLAGKKPVGAVLDEACALVGKDISPIDDIRSTAQYRLLVSQNLLRSFLTGG